VAVWRTFGPEKDKVTGIWGKLHIEELHSFALFTQYFEGREIEGEQV
jgi:hypothetical protein